MNALKNKALLNKLGEKVTVFVAEKGADICVGDFVAVNTRTLQANTIQPESGYRTVGIAIKIIKDENGIMWVICKDGLYWVSNTPDVVNVIDINYLGRVCYFEDSRTVTLDNINTTVAGEIVSIDAEKGVLIRIDFDREEWQW